jgi:hypothetical protein
MLGKDQWKKMAMLLLGVVVLTGLVLAIWNGVWQEMIRDKMRAQQIVYQLDLPGDRAQPKDLSLHHGLKRIKAK